VVLNQKGQFRCPNGTNSDRLATTPKAIPKTTGTAKSSDDNLKRIVANLKLRGNTKPRTLKTLTSTVAALFPQGLPQSELTALIAQLQATGTISVTDNKVTYAL
jgi:hypothetical protein